MMMKRKTKMIMIYVINLAFWSTYSFTWNFVMPFSKKPTI